MTQLQLTCSCGERITYELDESSLKAEFDKMGVVPILISHGDHFITAYIDSHLAVRSVERVILVRDDESSVVVKPKTEKEGDINSIVNNLILDKDPSKNFLSFLPLLLAKVKEPENLFTAGRIVGQYLWEKRREPIIKLGASFKIETDLLVKNEIKPIIEKMGKVEKKGTDNQTIVIKETISPQFIIGTVQGILDAIQKYMQTKINIAIEYVMSGETVFLTLQK